jgi:Family of unknown function (DUF5723)
MKNIFQIILFLFAVTTLSAQTGLLGYGSKAVVPAQMANPAMTGNVRSHIAFPIISSIQFEQKASFKISDWILKEEGKTYISPNKFAASALARNDMNTNLGIDIFSVGFSVKEKNYFSLGYQHFTTVYASFSDDLIKFLAEGNAKNPNISLNEESIYINQFNAAYLGYSRSLLDNKLNIGGRIKMLQGFGNFQTNNINFSITTDANASPAYAVNVAGSMQVQAGGLFGVLTDTTLNNNTAQNVMNNLTKMGKGIGFDLGMSYKITDKLTVSASAINIGNITWKKDFAQKMDFIGTGKFEFSGIKTNLNGGSNSNAADSVEQKFKDAFKIQRSKAEYSSPLPTMIYASASYNINAKNQATVVFRNQSFNGKSNTVMGINYAYSPFNAIQLLAGANMANFKSFSFGAGLVANLGSVQLHLLADNISGLMAIDNANRVQFQAGLNVILRKKVATPATPAPTPEETPKKVVITTKPNGKDIINSEPIKEVKEVVTAKGIIEKAVKKVQADVKVKAEAVLKEPKKLQDECGDVDAKTSEKMEEEAMSQAAMAAKDNQEYPNVPTSKEQAANTELKPVVTPKTIMSKPEPETKTMPKMDIPKQDLPKKEEAKKYIRGYK